MFFCLFTCLFKVMNTWQSFYRYRCHGMGAGPYFLVATIQQIHLFRCLPLRVSAFEENTKTGFVGQVELLLIARLPSELLPASPALCEACAASHHQHQLLRSLALFKASSQASQTFRLSDVNGCGFLPA